MARLVAVLLCAAALCVSHFAAAQPPGSTSTGVSSSRFAPPSGSPGEAGASTCLEATRGAGDVCRSTSQNFCCTLPSGPVATYTERVYPAQGRFCVNPANFFDCASFRCVGKDEKCS
jgi:hypothetical protein